MGYDLERLRKTAVRAFTLAANESPHFMDIIPGDPAIEGVLGGGGVNGQGRKVRVEKISAGLNHMPFALIEFSIEGDKDPLRARFDTGKAAFLDDTGHIEHAITGLKETILTYISEMTEYLEHQEYLQRPDKPDITVKSRP